jgi:MraZ protein
VERSGRLWKKVTVSLLHGEYELTLDDKNRLLIPAEIRRRLNSTDERGVFFIKLGTNGVPWLYSASRWTDLASGGVSGMDPGDEQLDHDHFHYGMTYELEWDKQGRAVIPDRMLRKTGIGKEVMLVGIKDHLELWNRAAWEEHTDALLAMYAQRGKTRQAQVPQGNV